MSRVGFIRLKTGRAPYWRGGFQVDRVPLIVAVEMIALVAMIALLGDPDVEIATSVDGETFEVLTPSMRADALTMLEGISPSEPLPDGEPDLRWADGLIETQFAPVASPTSDLQAKAETEAQHINADAEAARISGADIVVVTTPAAVGTQDAVAAAPVSLAAVTETGGTVTSEPAAPTHVVIEPTAPAAAAAATTQTARGRKPTA